MTSSGPESQVGSWGSFLPRVATVLWFLWGRRADGNHRRRRRCKGRAGDLSTRRALQVSEQLVLRSRWDRLSQGCPPVGDRMGRGAAEETGLRRSRSKQEGAVRVEVLSSDLPWGQGSLTQGLVILGSPHPARPASSESSVCPFLHDLAPQRCQRF